jgi:hypothetical protein
MKLVQTLSALALVGAAAPTAFALSVKDDQLSVALKFQVQSRAYLLNDGENATGGAYDPLRGSDGDAEAVRFDLRRARLGFAAKYNEDWRGVFLIRSENNDRGVNGGASTGNGGNGRPVQLYFANAARVFKQRDDIEHDLHAGLDKPFNSESRISSTTYLMPQDRLSLSYIEFRGVGGGYGFRSPMVNFGFDVQNNTTGTKDTQARNDTGAEETNGYFYSARVEFMPGKEWNPGKAMESFAGKEGTHLVVGFDYQADMGNLQDDGAAATFVEQDQTIFGPDVLLHWNFLTVLAEYRFLKTTRDTVTDATGATASADTDGTLWNIGAGWAIPVGGYFVEPCVRFGERDSDDDTDSTASFAAGPGGNIGNDIGSDGTTLELGVNLYISGHSNKIQLSYQNWKAEEGDATADIIRLQHQWAF